MIEISENLRTMLLIGSVIGLFFIGGGIATYRKYLQLQRIRRDMTRWPSTTGSIIHFELIEFVNRRGRYAIEPDIRFTFSHEGKEYTGTQVYYFPFVLKHERTPPVEQLPDYARMDEVDVYYNPQNPRECVLNPDPTITEPRVDWMPAESLLLASLGIGVFVFLALFLQRLGGA